MSDFNYSNQELINVAKYEYGGETFQIDGAGDCELKVSDDANTVTISPRPSSGGYTITANGRGRYGGNSVNDAVRNACQELIDERTRPTRDELCDSMSTFIEELGKTD
ncbi:MAG: hypothetical protein OXE52_13870 [Chloroflexi bacterium]|nr:hypothetical protein [Chloroflexota bacterium]